MKKYLLFTFLIILFNSLESYSNTYGNGDNQFGRHVIQTQDGGFLLSGTNSNPDGVYLVKLDNLLQVQWTKVILPSEHYYPLTYVAQVPSTQEYLLLLYSTDSVISGVDTIAQEGPGILKLTSTGDTLFSKCYPINIDYSGCFGHSPFFLGRLTNSNFLVGYEEACVGFHHNSITYIIDSNADTLGVNGGSGGGYSNIDIFDSSYIATSTEVLGVNGGVIVNGTLLWYDSTFVLTYRPYSSAFAGHDILTVGNFNNQFFVGKSDSIRNIVWSKNWGSGLLYKIQEYTDTEFYVLGINDTLAGANKGFFSKIDSAANFKWTKYPDSLVHISDIITLDNNRFALVGDSLNTSIGTSDFWFAIYDSSGSQITQLISWSDFLEESYSSNLFPNPSNGSFTIDIGKNYSDLNKYEIRIFDVVGREVKSLIQKAKVSSYNFSNLRKGFYNVVISTSGFKEVHKLLVE
jgi:hypothetical protein